MKKNHPDSVLMGALLAMAPLAAAQDTKLPHDEAQDHSTVIECSDDTCTGEEGLLFRLRTRSYDKPRSHGTTERSSSEALQPDRRATIAREKPSKATVVGEFSIALPDGGVIWATEDPSLGQPELSVSAPALAAFDGGRIVAPVQFLVRGNYTAFVERYELSIYRSIDGDLIDPIASVAVAVAAVSRAEWTAELPAKYQFRAGDELVYVLRAYARNGAFDETHPRTIQLVRPDEAERSSQRLRSSAEGNLGAALTLDQAMERSLLDHVFAENGLRQQNIPIHGSRIRLQGRNLPQNTALTINGDSHPVDQERKFVAEYLVPIGRHSFDLEIRDGAAEAKARVRHTLDVDVTGSYFFAIGLADATVSQNDISGSFAQFATDSRQEDDVIADGRLAFYLKAKAKAKYLITAQADTTERDIEHLFEGFTRADPRDVFRRLDPDRFYPTYGDDSTTYRDVDTMGRLYLRVDWDKNQALWGNYATGMTGTDYAQYVRSLYGAALNWRSRGINAWGDPSTELRAFGSDAETAPGHDEFVGTGGSLYYLKHTDILPGSDDVVLEVRDLATGRVENRIPLLRGADYELEEFQGRLLLTRALAQITRENTTTLTRDTPLDGFEQRLVVDYEWQTSGLDSGELTTGVRGKQWFGDRVGVGLTYVDENRAGDDYSIVGSDLTLQAGKATYLKAEYVRTELATSPVFFSDNGGFTFSQISAAGPLEGDARSLEARANFKELGWTDQEWATGAWWRDTGTGFSVSRYSTGEPVTEIGAEILGNFAPNLRSYARYSRAESGADALIQTQAMLEWRIGDLDTVSGEVRRVEQEAASADATGVLGALKYTRRFGTALDLYGLAQLTLDDDDDRYPSNDAFAVGANYLFDERYSMGSEISSGDRGDAATINAEYRMSPEHAIYGARTYSTDTTQYQSLFDPNRQNGWTLGQRWRLSNQVNLFNESQFLKEPDQSGLAHTFGMDFFPARGWNLGIALQEGGLTRIAAGNVDRRGVSLTSGRRSPDTDWQSKLEWREDSGAERREQWVTTHRLTRKINESWRIAARFNYSKTEDEIDPTAGAKFIEGNVGFSWRPWNSTRWGAFGRYTYLYDLATLDQVSGAQYDQRSQILSLEGVYRNGPRWECAGKLARREGEVRFGRGAGEWADSAATLAALQVRYELHMKWHALAEYRWLAVDHGGTRQGFLVGLDRDINQHFRLGVGYNFTGFSDDLTDFDYDHRGAFINLVGMY